MLRWSVLGLITLGVWTPSAQAQTTTPPPLPVPQPLPEFHFEAGYAEYRGSKAILSNKPAFYWGDVTLTADNIVVDKLTNQIEAAGGAKFTRGDEVIQGGRITLNGDTGVIEVSDAVALSPPFRVEGRTLYRDPQTLRVLDASLGLRPGGGGEIGFRADEIRIGNATKLTLRNAKIYLYGKRLFTVRHLTIPITLDPEYGGTGQSTAPPPVTFRLSGISGQALGFGNQFNISSNTNLGVQFEQTTRQGFQYTIGTQTTLVGPRVEDQGRQLNATPGGRGERITERQRRQARGEPEPAPVSPLRQLLTKRVPPPAPDPVLDFVDILPTGNPLSRPTRTVIRSVSLATTYAHNREFGARRQSALLLSREPEAQIVANIPLYRPLRVTNTEETRQDLRRPRYFGFGQVQVGRYHETRLKEGLTDFSGNRTGLVAGVGSLPILLGRRTLLFGQSAINFSRYDGGQTYTFSETSLATEYIVRERSGIGAAVIRRITTGSTPFLFDQIDTQNEAQLRFQTTGGKESRYTFALLTRFDVKQQTLFDIEFAVARRGQLLEPRFTYKRLNRQFGFSLAIVGITQR